MVVTGGLGMIGSIVGSWLITQSAAKVVLLGRSGRPGRDSTAVLDMLRSGADAMITMLRCDVSSAEEISALASASSTDCPLQVLLFGTCMRSPHSLP